MPKSRAEAKQRRHLARVAALEAVLDYLKDLERRDLAPMPLDAQDAFRWKVASIRSQVARGTCYEHIGRSPRMWIDPMRSPADQMSSADE